MSKRTFQEFLQSLVDSGTDYWVETITREDALLLIETHNNLEALKEGLPNLSALGIAIRDAEYILKVLSVVKYEVEALEKSEFTTDSETKDEGVNE